MSGAGPSTLYDQVTASVDPDSPSPNRSRYDLRGRRLGRYLVLGLLGHGGMGVVVEAHDEKLDRSVAVKLLNPGAMKRGEVRLLREAQALARLSHPNVVQIYDIGELDGQTFIAMELVRGRTLRVWAHEPHSWRTVVSVYLQAARGLAAAHAKGLMHRDFKPDNCIIDEEGRVRVLDFGLARELAPSNLASMPDDDLDLEEEPAPHVLGDKLTRPGALMGTLGYMALEQLEGHLADAYSDQFAFCASLYEALYGETPYPGESVASVFTAMRTGDRRPTPVGVIVPRRLSRALWRGMSNASADRWPSMDALIHELEALSSTRRSRAIVVGLGVGLAVTAGLAFMREAPDPCPDVATALAGTWDADIRHGVEQAFALHGPADPTLLSRLVERLDVYANAWATMTMDACRATFVVRRQSEAQLEHRTRCLERRRNRFVATVAALADAENGSELTQAVVLPFRLPTLDPCAETTSEGLEAPLPLVQHDERHAAVRRDIDEAITLLEAGRIPKGTTLAEAAVVTARGLGEPVLLAEALECLGRLQGEGGATNEARATLEDAILTGTQAGDDASTARAWITLLYVTALRGERDRAEHYELPARAAVARTNDDVLRAWLLNNLGILAAEQGRQALARTRFEESLALKQAALGPDHVDVAIAWQNLGALLSDTGDPRGALDALARARTIFGSTVGEAHPWNIHLLFNSCRAEQDLGHPSEAIELCQRAIDGFASYSSPSLESRARFTLAEILLDAGRQDEARVMARRAIEVGELENPELTERWERWLSTLDQTTDNPP